MFEFHPRSTWSLFKSIPASYLCIPTVPAWMVGPLGPVLSARQINPGFRSVHQHNPFPQLHQLVELVKTFRTVYLSAKSPQPFGRYGALKLSVWVTELSVRYVRLSVPPIELSVSATELSVSAVWLSVSAVWLSVSAARVERLSSSVEHLCKLDKPFSWLATRLRR